MPRPPSLAVYLPGLAGGGAERAQVNLAPAFVERGVDVTFVLHQATGENLARVPRQAQVVSLEAGRTLGALPKLAAYLRRTRPDILISNLGHNNVLALWANKLAGEVAQVVICQQSVMTQERDEAGTWQHRALPHLYRLFSHWAARVIPVSQGVAQDLISFAGVQPQRVSVIENPVVFAAVDESNASVPHPWLRAKEHPLFVAAGRLVPTKDFGSLLRAFARLDTKLAARLMILGEGPLRGELEALASTLGVSDRVAFVGFAADPYPYFRAADALVLTSRHEGFGNVLIEAMACGTPVVSTDCPVGPAEILCGGRFGALVPLDDLPALTRAMQDVLRARPDAAALRARARDFHVDAIAERYLEVFASVAPSFRSALSPRSRESPAPPALT